MKSTLSFSAVVEHLESLQIMPKTMPGLEKINQSLLDTDLLRLIDPAKVIVVAGTNGKGSTCATLEALLLSAQKKVGFYSSPHLIKTTERIRVNGVDISEMDFVNLHSICLPQITKFQLTHFEALTLMMCMYFFSPKFNLELDYVLLEVGLGGTFDATNAVPHDFCVLAPIDFDHVNILGPTIKDIALNKLGIIHKASDVVVYQNPSSDLRPVFETYFSAKKCRPVQVRDFEVELMESKGFTLSEPLTFLKSPWGLAELALKGQRGAQNTMTALTVFAELGFDPSKHLTALKKVRWPGRMQKIIWTVNETNVSRDVYLSGDHNPQGIQSLLSILDNFKWKQLRLIVGIGLDKDEKQILEPLFTLSDCAVYLTETPFKGRKIEHYQQDFLTRSFYKNEDAIVSLNQAVKDAKADDLIVVTGSLYLVGQLLAHHQKI